MSILFTEHVDTCSGRTNAEPWIVREKILVCSAGKARRARQSTPSHTHTQVQVHTGTSNDRPLAVAEAVVLLLFLRRTGLSALVRVLASCPSQKKKTLRASWWSQK